MNPLKLREKWEESGLLEGLTFQEQIEMSVYFEELLTMFKDTVLPKQKYVLFMFAVVRRIYLQHTAIPLNVREIYDEFRNFIESDYAITLRQLLSPVCDVEAELISKFADTYYE